MSSFGCRVLAFALSCAGASAAALVAVPTVTPTLPVPGLEPNRGQAAAGILFLRRGSASLAVTAQSVLYSPLGATLSLVAGNANPTVSFSDPLPGLANYYTGANSQKWVTGVSRYGAATLAGVYPGVDVLYNQDPTGNLTLNLLFQAGIDPKTVIFEIDPAVQLALGSDGSIWAQFGVTSFSPQLNFPAPTAFQTTGSGPLVMVSRSVSFTLLSATRFSVQVQGLDLTLPLQIALNVNGPASSPIATTVRTADATGNLYFAATIADAVASVSAGAVEECGVSPILPVACTDVAVYKFSPAGGLAFVTYLAGRTQETAGFIGIAPDGSVMLAGDTDSSDFPVTAAALQPVYAGPPAALGPMGNSTVEGSFFAAKLGSATGQLLASTYLGGSTAANMGTAALGADGSLYFLPVWLGAITLDMPVTSGALQASCQGDPCQNGYVARLSPGLDKLIYGTYLPGDVQAGAQLYSDGSVYYAGAAQAGFPVTPNAYQQQNAGDYDGLVARLDPTGSRLLFATYLGGPATDWILRLAVAPDGSVWVTVDSFVQCCINIQSQLLHFDANGERLLAQVPVSVDQMTVDAQGDLIATEFGSVTASPSAFLSSSCGSDSYVRMDSAGNQLFATYLPPGNYSFGGSSAVGTPILLTASGAVQVVESQSISSPYAGCMVDGASFSNESTTSPGAIVTVFGSGLGPNQGTGFGLVNGLVPTSLGGTQALVNGQPVPILFSSYWQVNLVLPYSLPVGTIPTVQVVSGETASNTLADADVQPAAISLFQVNGTAVALNQDGTVNSPLNPAKAGSTVSLFGTGGGQTGPPSVAGEVTPSEQRPLAEQPQVQIYDGPMLVVTYAGAAPDLVSGVTQIKVQLPSAIPAVAGFASGTLPIQIVRPALSFNPGYVTLSVAVN